MQLHTAQLRTICHHILFTTFNPKVSSPAVANLLIASLANSSHHLPTYFLFMLIYTHLQILTPSQFPKTITHTQLPKCAADNYY